MSKKNVPTYLDRQINDKMNELRNIMRTLQNRVQQIFIKEKAISLYPDGSDKEKAIDDLETAKQTLLCSIGSYDCRRMELAELLKKDGERNTTFGILLPTTSHEYIECLIRGLIF